MYTFWIICLKHKNAIKWLHFSYISIWTLLQVLYHIGFEKKTILQFKN